MRPRLVIISPALADANDGNWQTARRWSRFLARDFDVAVSKAWDGSPADAMIALHARRSAASIEAFRERGGPVAVVLTGTDLYRDIRDDASAQRSLRFADRLVVLQERGTDELAPALRALPNRRRLAHPSGQARESTRRGRGHVAESPRSRLELPRPTRCAAAAPRGPCL